ncbi:MAG TPA: TetR/AcrR family transcriptional regulator [Polyangiaceae bacterium]|jgi:AcrR family transcriptional regulator
MPAPPKTNDAEIVDAAWKLVESKGHAGFSMNDVALAVGVRAPSLYGRFADRAALLSVVQVEIWSALGRAVTKAPRSSDPVAALTAQCRAYRAFAKRHPRSYTLIHDAAAERTEAGQRARESAFAAALPQLLALVGETHALSAGRTLVPYIHGFVSMEIAGAFRLGGSVDLAFERGVATILAGLTHDGASGPSSAKKRVRR